jgi:hypothetical protein
MVNKVLATLAYEVAFKTGDTTTAFIARIKDFLNDRNDDAILRSGATAWTTASLARLGDTDIPTLGLGEVIKEGALADAWDAKRQYGKSQKHEMKFERKLGNYIMSGDFNRINASVGRYDYHEV